VTAGLDAHALRDRYTQRVAAQEEFALNLKKKQLALKVCVHVTCHALDPHPSCGEPHSSWFGHHAPQNAGCRTTTVW